MNKFKVGDRVKVITNVHGELGKVFVIETVEGSDEVEHQTPYRDRGGYWHKASDLAIAAPATREPAPVSAAGERDVRSLPQRYRDERMAAQERGEAIKDYTAWLESQVKSAEFDRSVLRNLNDENRKHMLFMNDEIDKDFQRIGDLLEMRGKFKRDYGTNKIVEQLTDLRAQLAAATELAETLRGERDALLAAIRKWTYTSMDGFTFVTDDHGEVAATALAASDGEG